MAEIIAKLGKNCYIYKLDLSRAYRQLPCDPLDWPLLGIEWDENFYVDTKVPFGLRHGAQYCERVTSAVCYAAKQRHDADVVAYIDDMGGGAPDDLDYATKQFNAVCNTVTEMGLSLAPEKCQGPSRVMSWTGSTFDTVEMIMRIDEEKIQESLDLAKSYLHKTDITIKDIEILLGKLQHSIKFCPGARRFLNRLLMMRREMLEDKTYRLTTGAVDDLSWFISFLSDFNGVAVIRSQFIPTVIVYVDACLIGGGSLWEGVSFVSYKWPEHVVKWCLAINDLEMFNVLVSIRKWKEKLRGHTVRIWCDNNTSVKSLFSGRARNNFMNSCLRELWYMASAGDIFIDCKHIAGVDNNVADLLSRAFNTQDDWNKYQDWSMKSNLKMTSVNVDDFRFPDTI